MDTNSLDQLLMDVIREMGAHRPEQLLPGWSLSLSEIYALSLLAERAPLSQQELGAALALEKSSISRLVQQLEQRGWVTRERDARDSRLRLLRLSEQGARMTAEMRRRMHERHAEAFNQLSGEEQRALIMGLTALRQALRDTPYQPKPVSEERRGSQH
ncbi:MAG TPA: MarR family transcriptional regulator [Ktedonobacterales bacterium]